jgi:DNA-directed RNA polymerase specialized sigma24 family protein
MVVDELLAKLSPTHQGIVRLRIDGCEVNEIAQQMNCSKRSVERVLQGFRQLLSSQLRDDDENHS